MAGSETLSLTVTFSALDRLTRPMRQILDGTRATAAGIADTRRELTQLRSAQQRVAAFKGLENQLRTQSARLDEAREKTRRMREEIERVERPTKRMAQAFERAQRDESRLATEHERQGRALADMARRFDQAGVDVAELGQHEERLRRQISQTTAALSEQTQALASRNAASARIEALDQQSSQLSAAGMEDMQTGLTIGAPLVGAAWTYGGYQQTLTDIQLKIRGSRVEMERIGRVLDDLGPRIGQLPHDLATGVDTLVGMGAALPDAMRMIEPIGRVATAYRARVEDLAQATFASMQNLRVETNQTGRALDVMAEAGKQGAFEIRDMAQYFPQLTASMQALGQRGVPAVADLAAALQIARTATGDSATAANNLQNLLNKINTRDTEENFRRLGVNFRREMRLMERAGMSPIEAIATLTNRALGGDMSRLSHLFGDAQVQAALRPLVQQLPEYRRIREEAMRANGTGTADFNERLSDTNTQFNQLLATLEALAHVIGGQVLPAANGLLTNVRWFIDGMNSFATNYPQLTGWILEIVKWLAIFKLGFGLLRRLGGFLVGFWRDLVKLRGLLKAIPGALRSAWNAAWPHVKAFFSGFAALFRNLWGWIKWLGQGLWWLVTRLTPIGRLLLVLITIGGLVWRYWAQVSAFFSRLWVLLAAGARAAWAGIVAGFQQQMARFNAMAGWVRGVWNGLVSWFGQLGANIVNGLVNGLTSRWEAARARVQSMASEVRGWFAERLGIRSPSRVFMALGQHITGGLALGLDRGGREPVRRIETIAARMARAVAVGGAGAGLATAAAAAAAPAVASPPGGPVTINIYPQPGQSAPDIARAVAAAFDRRARDAAARRGASYADD